MLYLLRLHIDTDLDERVQYILKTYEYICKVPPDPLYDSDTTGQDETNFARILSTVEKYAGRRSGETWAELESRSNYKELVSESRGKNDNGERICLAGGRHGRCAQPDLEADGDQRGRNRLASSPLSHRTQD